MNRVSDVFPKFSAININQYINNDNINTQKKRTMLEFFPGLGYLSYLLICLLTVYLAYSSRFTRAQVLSLSTLTNPFISFEVPYSS